MSRNITYLDETMLHGEYRCGVNGGAEAMKSHKSMYERIVDTFIVIALIGVPTLFIFAILTFFGGTPQHLSKKGIDSALLFTQAFSSLFALIALIAAKWFNKSRIENQEKQIELQFHTLNDEPLARVMNIYSAQAVFLETWSELSYFLRKELDTFMVTHLSKIESEDDPNVIDAMFRQAAETAISELKESSAQIRLDHIKNGFSKLIGLYDELPKHIRSSVLFNDAFKLSDTFSPFEYIDTRNSAEKQSSISHTIDRYRGAKTIGEYIHSVSILVQRITIEDIMNPFWILLTRDNSDTEFFEVELFGLAMMRISKNDAGRIIYEENSCIDNEGLAHILSLYRMSYNNGKNIANSLGEISDIEVPSNTITMITKFDKYISNRLSYYTDNYEKLESLLCPCRGGDEKTPHKEKGGKLAKREKLWSSKRIFEHSNGIREKAFLAPDNVITRAIMREKKLERDSITLNQYKEMQTRFRTSIVRVLGVDSTI